MQIINPLDIDNWDELIGEMEGATVFHSSAWLRVLQDTYNFKPVYFVENGDGHVNTLLPLVEIKSIFTGKRAVGLPFSDHCAPLYSRPGDIKKLIDHAISYGYQSGWKRLEIRGGEPEDMGGAPSIEYYTHEIDLEKLPDELWGILHENARRNTRKALRSGVEAKILNTVAGIREFYRLMCLTRKRHGLPPQPFHFFLKVHNQLLSRGFGDLWLALYDGKVIAGAVFFVFRGNVLFKYGASDIRYQDLRANNLLMWDAMNYYSSRSCDTLNLGRTDVENEGLRRFKKTMGGKESRIRYYTYDLPRGCFVKDHSAVKNWQKAIVRSLPLALLPFLGAVLYRHAG